MEVLLENVHFLHEVLQGLLALLLGQQPVWILHDRGAELRLEEAMECPAPDTWTVGGGLHGGGVA